MSQRSTSARRRFATAALMALSLLGPGALAAQGEGEASGEGAVAAKPAVTIEAVEVTPAKPAVDTLCQLRVRLRNAAESTVSALRFTVEVGGHDLPVYDTQVFMDPLPPGEVTEVKLYNFWTTETGRPAPKGGKLKVAVTLVGARRLEIATEEDGVETWTLLEALPGLPAGAEVVLPLAGS